MVLPLFDHKSSVEAKVEQPHNRKVTRRTVLVIDDNRDLAESTRMILEMNGHRVVLAHSGAEGLSLAKSIHPDVIICDIGLPRMNDTMSAKNFAPIPSWLIH